MFSGLANQLRDISLNEEFTGFCCITESKLRKTFSPEIKAKSEKRQYQTVYLTIADYDAEGCEYTLDFPNHEVKYGFLQNLMPEYVSDCGASSGLDVFTLRRYTNKGNIEGIMKVLTALFSRITYTKIKDPFEHYFQTVIYLVFTLLGQFSE